MGKFVVYREQIDGIWRTSGYVLVSESAVYGEVINDLACLCTYFSSSELLVYSERIDGFQSQKKHWVYNYCWRIDRQLPLTTLQVVLLSIILCSQV